VLRRALNRQVKSTPVLRAALKSSRIAAAVLALATIATAAMLALLPAEPWLRAVGVVVAGGCGLHALRITAAVGASGSMASIELAADRRIVITDRFGRTSAAICRPNRSVITMRRTSSGAYGCSCGTAIAVATTPDRR